MNDGAPSRFLNSIRDRKLLEEYPFDMLRRLQAAGQSPKHHPEGSVWNHTLLVVDEAAKVRGRSRNGRAFMWAALLHDIGKPPTTKVRKGKITSYDHDRVGAEMADEFLRAFISDEGFIGEVRALVRYHMHILYVVNGLPFADMEGLKARTDAGEVALLGLCDRLGRLGCDREKEEKDIATFLERVN